MQNKQKGLTALILVTLIAAGLILAGGGYYYGTLSAKTAIEPSGAPTATAISSLSPTAKPTVSPTVQPTAVTKTETPKPMSTLGKSERTITYKETNGPSSSYVIEGRVFNDTNCNELRESNEGGLANVEVNLSTIPEYYSVGTLKTDAAGYFKFTGALEKKPSSFQVSSVSPQGYQSNPRFNPSFGTVILNDATASVFVNLPQLPYTALATCRQ